MAGRRTSPDRGCPEDDGVDLHGQVQHEGIGTHHIPPDHPCPPGRPEPVGIGAQAALRDARNFSLPPQPKRPHPPLVPLAQPWPVRAWTPSTSWTMRPRSWRCCVGDEGPQGGALHVWRRLAQSPGLQPPSAGLGPPTPGQMQDKQMAMYKALERRTHPCTHGSDMIEPFHSVEKLSGERDTAPLCMPSSPRGGPMTSMRTSDGGGRAAPGTSLPWSMSTPTATASSTSTVSGAACPPGRPRV